MSTLPFCGHLILNCLIFEECYWLMRKRNSLSVYMAPKFLMFVRWM